MKRFLALLIFLTAASAQAASSDGQIQADGLEGSKEASIHGSLLAYSVQGTGVSGFEATLRVDAARIVVEIDEAETHYTVGGFGAGRDQRTLQFEGDRIVGSSTHPGLKLWAMPHKGPVQFAGEGQRAQASSQATLNEPDYQLNHTANTVDVVGSLEWVAQGAHSAAMEGSLYFSDRQFPFRLYDGEELVYEFEGDTIPDEIAPGVRSGDVVRAAHVWAEDAVLRVDSTTAHQTQAYLMPKSVNAVGPWNMKDASGELHQASERISVDGDHLLDAESRLEGFSIEDNRVAFRVESTKVEIPAPQEPQKEPRGSDPIPKSSVTAPANGLWSPKLVSIALGFIGLGGLLGIRERPKFKAVKRALDRERYAYVVRKAPRFLANPEFAAEASLMKGISLVALHRFNEACEFLQSLSPDQHMDNATWHYLMATARAQQGKKEEAVNHVQRCLEASPEYIVEITDNAVLKDLITQPLRGPGPASMEGYQ